jgi:hypothetical protein
MRVTIPATSNDSNECWVCKNTRVAPQVYDEAEGTYITFDQALERIGEGSDGKQQNSNDQPGSP